MIMSKNKKAIIAFAVIVYFVINRVFVENALVEFVAGGIQNSYRVSSLTSVAVWAAFATWVVLKRFRLNRKSLTPLFIIALYFVCLLVSTVLNGIELRFLINNVLLNTMSVLLLIVMACEKEENAKQFISGVVWLYIICVFLNAVSIFSGSAWSALMGGRSAQCFIGNFDTSGFAVELGVFYALLDSHINGSRKKLWLYIAVAALDVAAVLRLSGTTVITMALIALFAVPFVRRFAERTNLMVFVALAVAFLAVLTWMWTPLMNLEPVRVLITDVLQKDLSMSGRTDQFPRIVSDYIAQKPLLGFGVKDQPFLTIDNIVWAGSYYEQLLLYHTNSQILQTWYEGGLVAIAVILALFILTAGLLKKMKDERMAGIFKWMLFAFMIAYTGDIMPGMNWVCIFEIITLAFTVEYGKDGKQSI